MATCTRIGFLPLVATMVAGCLGSGAGGDVQVRLIQKWSGRPAAGVTIYATDRGRVVDSAVTDADGLAEVRVVEGGEITAALRWFYPPQSTWRVALTLGAIQQGREYTLVWPWPGFLLDPAPLQEIEIAVSGAPSAAGSTELRVGAGGCRTLIFGTTGTLTLSDYCAAANGSFLVFASSAGEEYGATLMPEGTTNLHIALEEVPRTKVIHEGVLPAGIASPGSFVSGVWPTHLSMSAEYPSYVDDWPSPVVDSFSIEHFVHTSMADGLGAYIFVAKEDESFMVVRNFPLADAVAFDDLDADYCPFEALDSKGLDRHGSEAIEWRNRCTDGTAILIGRRESRDGESMEWIGIHPPNAEITHVPAIPELDFTPEIEVGGAFLRLDPALAYDDPRVWGDRLPPHDGSHPYSRTSYRLPPSTL